MSGEQLTIANDYAELRRMTQWLRESSAAAGLPSNMVWQLDLCANEAVTNIITYAYDDAIRHDITLELSLAGPRARLVIRDDGKPFNVLAVPAHKFPARLEDAMVGGLGIHLIRSLMARCEYQRINDQNVLCLETHQVSPPGNA